MRTTNKQKLARLSKDDVAAKILMLYYSGRASEGRKLMDRAKMTGEKVDDYHQHFIAQLKHSPFVKDVQAVNYGQL